METLFQLFKSLIIIMYPGIRRGFLAESHPVKGWLPFHICVQK